jgi:hypothetical protein
MKFIKFEAEFKRQFENLQREWGNSLPKEPGVLTLHRDVWGPPDGTMLSVGGCTADFIAFLRKKGFRFRE